MDVQDEHGRVSLASRCGKKLEGAFDGGVLASLPVRLPAAPNAAQAGRPAAGLPAAAGQAGTQVTSGTLLLREVEASTGVLSRMVDALKRSLEQTLERVERTFLSAHIHQTESCVQARHDSPPSPPLEEGRRTPPSHTLPERLDRPLCGGGND